MDAAGSAKT